MQQIKLHIQAEKDHFHDLWYDYHPVIVVINIVDIKFSDFVYYYSG